MSVKIADKIVQYNNGSYFLMDSSAVEYIDKNIRKKLDLLHKKGLNTDLFDKVWSLKQKYTLELINNFESDIRIINILKSLKQKTIMW